MEILCFYAGMIFFYTKSVYALCFLAVALFLGASRYILIWFGLAYVFGFLHQFLIYDKSMPKQSVIPKARLIGEIQSIPIHSDKKISFEFSLKQLNGKPARAKILLSCFSKCPVFKLGQSWNFEAKIKLADSYGNPGSFDYKSWLDSHHIQWIGYLKPANSYLLNQVAHKNQILVWREKLASNLAAAISDKEVLGVVQALTLGMTQYISKENWDLFRRTGTTHLMVISGSHIALIAGFVFFILRFLWSQSYSLCLYRPATEIAAFGSLVASAFYSLLAGMAVPAQRALFASVFLLLPNFISQRFSGWQAWRYALFGVLIFEPHSVLQAGFYLSFIAVAILMSVNQRFSHKGIKQVLLSQLSCLLGLMPLTLYWYSYGALSGLVANLLAIPLVGYVIVPLSLLALAVSSFISISWLLPLLSYSVQILFSYLAWLDKFSSINISYFLDQFSSLLALMLALLILIFLPIRLFLLPCFILVLSVFFRSYPTVKLNDAAIDVLDVGQGLAIVIRTNKHILIYDTGMKFYQGGDMGQLVIIPYLKTLGVKKINKLIISHPDLDHRGGLASIEKAYPIKELIVDKVEFYKRGHSCHNSKPWLWDGVNFKFFPIKQSFRDKNNSSCVLKIWSSQGSALLPGDIEYLAENYLVSKYSNKLASKVLIVAHHGSKTSSRLEFIKQVAPNYAIISAGRDNRYHFPHAKTLSTLKREQIKIFNTASCGMASFSLSNIVNGIRCYKNNNGA